MIAVIIVAMVLAVLLGWTVVVIAKSMFTSPGRHERRWDDNTPGMIHFVDPYISRLVDDLYRGANRKTKKGKSHV